VRSVGAALGTVLACMPLAALAQTAAGPSTDAAIVKAAKSEGKVSVYAPIDAAVMGQFIDDFQSLYPEIKVEYTDLNTNVIYNRFISEVAGGQASADVVWSSALDLQMKLASDGYALQYESPEVAKLPSWVSWEGQAFGTSFEPFVFVYNKRLLAENLVPKDHDEMFALLSSNEAVRGKVGGQNIETSGLAFYAITQDATHYANFDAIPTALGKAKARFYTSVGEIMESIGSGENVIAYNVGASYANRSSKTNPDIGIVYPSDYIAVLSRIAILNAQAAQPNAAKLFLDYLLSPRGQSIMASANLFSLRSDVDSPQSAGALEAANPGKLRPPVVGPDLLKYLDPAARIQFLEAWKTALRSNG
jgi:iron(III) transport system substrate-binding protein